MWQLKAAMLSLFKYWGLPRAIKVDNGRPFGDPQRTSVPELALWLVGLGVEVISIPPRSPRKNAKVERMQATTAAWAEVNSCHDCNSLQKALDRVAYIQREKYEVRRLGGKSRKQFYAALWANRRRYKGGSFDIRRVYRYLSKVTFKRKVNNNGSFNFYAQKVYLGRGRRSTVVDITFDGGKKYFRVSGESAEAFAYFSADNFTEHAIQTFSVCRNRVLSAANLCRK